MVNTSYAASERGARYRFRKADEPISVTFPRAREQTLSAPDLSNLARLAQNPAAELRPLLLRVQAQDFARAQEHDEASRTRFEALALGLIPLVSDDVLAELAILLRPVADSPASVLDAIATRLRGHAAAAGPAPSDHGPTAAVHDAAREDAAMGEVLPGRTGESLVEHAIHQPALARALLQRPDLSAFDRAALYRWASREERAGIRQDLAPALASAGRQVAAAPGMLVPTVIRAAEAGDLAAILAAVVTRLRVDPEPFDLDSEPGRELFVMALLALGLDEVECIRVVILLGTTPFRSIPVVTELARIARGTPWIVASYLAGSDGPARRRSPADVLPLSSRTARSFSRERRSDPGRLSARPTGRAEAPIVRIDRRP